MRNRTILVAVLISPYLSQKVVGLGVRVSAGSTLCVKSKDDHGPRRPGAVPRLGDPVAHQSATATARGVACVEKNFHVCDSSEVSSMVQAAMDADDVPRKPRSFRACFVQQE
jgi:hypothetical protein